MHSTAAEGALHRVEALGSSTARAAAPASAVRARLALPPRCAPFPTSFPRGANRRAHRPDGGRATAEAATLAGRRAWRSLPSNWDPTRFRRSARCTAPPSRARVAALADGREDVEEQVAAAKAHQDGDTEFGLVGHRRELEQVVEGDLEASPIANSLCAAIPTPAS